MGKYSLQTKTVFDNMSLSRCHISAILVVTSLYNIDYDVDQEVLSFSQYVVQFIKHFTELIIFNIQDYITENKER